MNCEQANELRARARKLGRDKSETLTDYFTASEILAFGNHLLRCDSCRRPIRDLGTKVMRTVERQVNELAEKCKQDPEIVYRVVQ